MAFDTHTISNPKEGITPEVKIAEPVQGIALTHHFYGPAANLTHEPVIDPTNIRRIDTGPQTLVEGVEQAPEMANVIKAGGCGLLGDCLNAGAQLTADVKSGATSPANLVKAPLKIAVDNTTPDLTLEVPVNTEWTRQANLEMNNLQPSGPGTSPSFS